MKALKNSSLIVSVFFIAVFFLESPLYANVIQVSNSNDSGTGSFREAISTATATPEADTIVFSPELEGETLTLVDGLFNLPSNLTIDGTNAPIIDGSSINNPGGFTMVGLFVMDQTNVTISGLRLVGFDNGIEIRGAVSNITIENNTVTPIEGSEDPVAIIYVSRLGEGGNNLRFINNTVTNGSFGIDCWDGGNLVQDVEISGNKVIGNTSSISIYLASSDGNRVENVLIADNLLLEGAGMYVLTAHGGNPSNDNHISDITIRHNLLLNSGPGIVCQIEEGSNSSITGLVIERNKMEGLPTGGVLVQIQNSEEFSFRLCWRSGLYLCVYSNQRHHRVSISCINCGRSFRAIYA